MSQRLEVFRSGREIYLQRRIHELLNADVRLNQLPEASTANKPLDNISSPEVKPVVPLQTIQPEIVTPPQAISEVPQQAADAEIISFPGQRAEPRNDEATDMQAMGDAAKLQIAMIHREAA